MATKPKPAQKPTKAKAVVAKPTQNKTPMVKPKVKEAVKAPPKKEVTEEPSTPCPSTASIISQMQNRIAMAVS